MLLRTDWTVCRKCDIIELVKTNLERTCACLFPKYFKPEGIGGKIMVNMIDTGHSSKLVRIYIPKLEMITDVWILDVAVGQSSKKAIS